MSLPANTIATFQKIQVKPVQWIVRQDPDLTYWLLVTLVDPERGDFVTVTTARGKQKTYKTIQAVMADIARVQSDAMVSIHFTR